MSDVDRPGPPAGDAYDWYRRGTALLESGDPAAAAELLAWVVLEEPAAASVRESLARALFDARRYDDAVREFEVLVELVPDAVNVQGGQLDEVIKPMLPLAEKLGSIACGLAEAAVARVDVKALGEIASHDVRVLELSALKGVFQKLVHDPVSYVNAPVLATQRGVEVALTSDSEAGDHRSLVRVALTLTDGTKVSVAGTVSGPRDVAKVVEVDGFDVDVPVSDHMAFFRYHDRPGVVGVVGRVLGEADVNIGGMQVSRDESGHALIVLTVDTAIPPQQLDTIVGEIGAHSGRAVDLV
mgnify:CR=1 FL=1